jgi:hypothetical protein
MLTTNVTNPFNFVMKQFSDGLAVIVFECNHSAPLRDLQFCFYKVFLGLFLFLSFIHSNIFIKNSHCFMKLEFWAAKKIVRMKIGFEENFVLLILC